MRSNLINNPCASNAATQSRSGVTVDGANVVAANIRASNGVIHVIDKVMLPSN